MTRDDIKGQIGEAAIERKECLEEISCYKARLKTALHRLTAFLDNNPLHEDNQRLLVLSSDPPEDAQNMSKP